MKLRYIVIALLLACSLLAAQDKAPAPPAKPDPTLNAEEQRTLQRLQDLYGELATKLVEARAQVKVLEEMGGSLQQRFAEFERSAVASRGFAPGGARLDPVERKVVAIAPPPKIEQKIEPKKGP